MANFRLVLGILIAIALLAPVAAHAVELAEIKVASAEKKIDLTVNYSGPAKTDVIYHYANNFVALRVAGLKLSADRVRNEMAPPTEEAAQCFKAIRFSQDAEGAEIRIYLVKPVTPADVLVVPMDDHLDIEILRPQQTGAARSDGKQGVDAQPADTPVEQDEPQEGTPAEAEPAPVESDEQPAAEPPVVEPAEQEPAEVEPADQEPAEVEPLEAEPQTPSEDANSIDVDGVEPGPGKSYKRFDLSKVQVAQVEIRGMPFREALMEMVARTGFNVVVGEVADNSGVVLNFAQKPMSLKSALDLFCMAYDLEYSVEDDAIVIKSK